MAERIILIEKKNGVQIEHFIPTTEYPQTSYRVPVVVPVPGRGGQLVSGYKIIDPFNKIQTSSSPSEH